MGMWQVVCRRARTMRRLAEHFWLAWCVYEQNADPATLEWRYHWDDQRYPGGAFEDHRVIFFEGSLVVKMLRSCSVYSLDLSPKVYQDSRSLDGRYSTVLVRNIFLLGRRVQQGRLILQINSSVVILDSDRHERAFFNKWGLFISTPWLARQLGRIIETLSCSNTMRNASARTESICGALNLRSPCIISQCEDLPGMGAY